jgi:hypothetical protein
MKRKVATLNSAKIGLDDGVHFREPIKPGGDSKFNPLIHRQSKVDSPLDQQAETGWRSQFHRNPRRTNS